MATLLGTLFVTLLVVGSSVSIRADTSPPCDDILETITDALRGIAEELQEQKETHNQILEILTRHVHVLSKGFVDLTVNMENNFNMSETRHNERHDHIQKQFIDINANMEKNLNITKAKDEDRHQNIIEQFQDIRDQVALQRLATVGGLQEAIQNLTNMEESVTFTLPQSSLAELPLADICDILAQPESQRNHTELENHPVSIRLADGPRDGQGRVEVLYKGVWGTVCHDSWSRVDAQVVCRQLGYSSTESIAKTDAFFGPGIGTIWLDDVSCIGSELNLGACGHNGWGVQDCQHTEDAGVICDIEPSPVVSTQPSTTETRKCDTDDDNAYQFGISSNSHFEYTALNSIFRKTSISNTGLITMDVRTSASNGILYIVSVLDVSDQPVSDSRHKEFAYIQDGYIKYGLAYESGIFTSLRSTLTINDGEWHHIRFYRQENQGTIRVDGVEVANGLIGASSEYRATFEHLYLGGIPKNYTVKYIDEVNAGSLLGCIKNLELNGVPAGEPIHSVHVEPCCAINEPEPEVVGTTTTPSTIRLVEGPTPTPSTIRLVEGRHPREGRLEVYHDSRWGTVCDDSWSIIDAQVVCRQLGYSTEGAVATSDAAFGQGTGDIWLDEVECIGSEERLEDCPHDEWGLEDCRHIEDAGVICQP